MRGRGRRRKEGVLEGDLDLYLAAHERGDGDRLGVAEAPGESGCSTGRGGRASEASRGLGGSCKAGIQVGPLLAMPSSAPAPT